MPAGSKYTNVQCLRLRFRPGSRYNASQTSLRGRFALKSEKEETGENKKEEEGSGKRTEDKKKKGWEPLGGTPSKCHSTKVLNLACKAVTSVSLLL